MSRASASAAAAVISAAAVALVWLPYWASPGVDRWLVLVALLLLTLHGLVFVSAEQVYGATGALASVAILATAVTAFRDAGLVFADTAGALAYTAAVYALSRSSLDPTPQSAGIAALACAVAALTPIGAAGVALLALATTAARALAPTPREPRLRSIQGAATAALLATVLGVGLAHAIGEHAPRIAGALNCDTEMPIGLHFAPLLMILGLAVARPWRAHRRHADLCWLAGVALLFWAFRGTDDAARRFATYAVWPLAALLAAGHFDCASGEARRSLVIGILLVAVITSLGFLG